MLLVSCIIYGSLNSINYRSLNFLKNYELEMMWHKYLPVANDKIAETLGKLI
jgi:hypothetical protein